MTTLIPKYDEGSTGAVNRPINLKLAEIVSVEDFGAVGDGVTDDTAAIQAAIDSFTIYTQGCVTFVAGKNYAISDKISSNNRYIYLKGNTANLTLTANSDYALELINGLCIVENLAIGKLAGVVSDCVLLSGIKHKISNVAPSASAWSVVFRLVGCKDTLISNITFDNDVASTTGDIFYLDYSISTTITNCVVGYCNTALYISSLLHPTLSYKSEGIIFTNNVTVNCNSAVHSVLTADLKIANNVLGFNQVNGILIDNGISLYITNNWIEGPVTDVAFNAISIGSGFTGAYVAGNYFINDQATPTGRSAISSNGAFVQFVNNHINGFNMGTLNQTSSYAFGNNLQGTGTVLGGSSGSFTISNASLNSSNGYSNFNQYLNNGGVNASTSWTTGAGSPEGVVTASIGSIYSRTNGGANTSLYVKETGTGNTGWIAK